jgi:hypothetical protein
MIVDISGKNDGVWPVLYSGFPAGLSLSVALVHSSPLLADRGCTGNADITVFFATQNFFYDQERVCVWIFF